MAIDKIGDKVNIEGNYKNDHISPEDGTHCVTCTNIVIAKPCKRIVSP